MGIPLDIFAVDLQPFEQFVNQTVWDGLCYIAEHGYPERPRGFEVYAELPPDPPEDDIFIAIPTVGVITRSRRPLSRDSDPVLQRRLCDYFNCQEEKIGYWKFFRAIASVPTLRFVTELSAGGGWQWWIDSLLRWAEQSASVRTEDFIRLKSIFSRMLGRCFFNSDENENRLVETIVNFPILPYRDPDESMSVIDESDANFLLRFLRTEVPQDEAVFRDSPLEPNPNHARAEERVRSAISELMKMDDLNYNQLRLVSIIG